MHCHLVVLLLASLSSLPSQATKQVLLPGMHHYRVGGEPEWSDFPQKAEAASLSMRFQSRRNPTERSLRLRQQDVKQTWKVLLNDQEIGRLVTDENDMVVYFPVPAGRLREGENVLTIVQVGTTPDDVRLGEITLSERPVSEVLNEATIEVKVRDTDQGNALPCRLTVLNSQGTLVTVGATPADHLAIRPGVIYTSTGSARFGLPAGEYVIHAGRGFAYGLATARIRLRVGETVKQELSIRREVLTPGYVSCDPHVHTLTHSGHGDATLHERVITLAGEGIDLPVATEHNKQVDYHAAALKYHVGTYFTPLVGNEVTTSLGHFNIFPIKPGATVPEHEVKDWPTLFRSIEERTQAPIVILNHGRDVHRGFRPFGPEHHNAATGENLDGWVLRANAMEVINSGSQQTDVLQLFRDWLTLMNRGQRLTPIGASDSHDVSRYVVGQGRTYVSTYNTSPGTINVDDAVENLKRGRVLVSCGLLAEIKVNDRYEPGHLAAAADVTDVKVTVHGPSWATAERVELYSNGVKIREAAIPQGSKPGVKWEGTWRLERPRHDVHLVALATGTGVTKLYWPIAKPYQPTTKVVNRRVMGCTGAVWIDADNNGQADAALDYAQRLVGQGEADVAKVLGALSRYDEAVAIQAAGLLAKRDVDLRSEAVMAAARKAGSHVEKAVIAVVEAQRESQLARSQAPRPN